MEEGRDAEWGQDEGVVVWVARLGLKLREEEKLLFGGELNDGSRWH